MSSSSSADLPVTILPKFIAIKNPDGYYLSLKSSGYLSFDSPSQTPLTTHEVLYNEDESTFVIRSANKRFWIRDPMSKWIAATYEGQPPTASKTSARFQVVKLQSGKLALQSAKDDKPYLRRVIFRGAEGFKADGTNLDASVEVVVSEASEYAISFTLPQFIHLKGQNGKYVHVHSEDGHNWLKYHGENPGELWGTFEVKSLLDGSVALYNPQVDRFWRNGHSWVWVDVNSNDLLKKECHFELVRVSNGVVAFKSKHNNRFCKRLTEHWEDAMNARAETTDEVDTRHSFSDAVESRKVFNVKYLLKLATTTDQKVMAVASGSVENTSTLTTNMLVTAIVSQKVSRSRSWSNSLTLKGGVKTTFKTGLPFVVEGKFDVEVGIEKSFSNEWGETTEENIEFQTQYTVEKVPSGGWATVTVTCSTAKMRIPFTYTSIDTATGGVERPPMDYIDGVYEGVDAYNIHAEISGGGENSL